MNEKITIAALSEELRQHEASIGRHWQYDEATNTLQTQRGSIVDLDTYGELVFKQIAPLRRRLPEAVFRLTEIVRGGVVFRFSRPGDRGSAYLWFMRDDGIPSMIGSILIDGNHAHEYEIISPVARRQQ